MTPKTPLARPALPDVDAPVGWPGETFAVFGPGALRWARELRRHLPGARLVRVELRHAEGFEVDDGDELTVHAHPDALLEALAEVRPAGAGFTVGVGPAFALATRPDRLVWIRRRDTLRSLPAALRERARAAHLVLEDARLETARALGERAARGHGQNRRQA